MSATADSPRESLSQASPRDLHYQEQHKAGSDESDREEGAHNISSPDRDNDSSQTASSSQGRDKHRPRTVDGKPIPFRGLSRNPRLQLALIEAVQSFKPFGYGNVKTGWKKVQEHMNAHKLMDPFEKDGVRHELSWQLCRDVFGRILDEWKISGKRQTKMDGVEIHDAERWNELVLDIHKLRQKQEGLDDKKRRRDDNRSATPSSGVDSEALSKQPRFDFTATLDAAQASPAQLPVHTTVGSGGLDISVFSPKVSWTSGSFASLPSVDADKGPTPGMVARAEDLQRSLGQHRDLGAQVAQARAIEKAAADLMQTKAHLQHSLLQAAGRVAVSAPAGRPPALQTGSFGGQGAGGMGMTSMDFQMHAHSQTAQHVQAQAQAQLQVLRESFARNPSGGEGGQATLERILQTMERQAEEQRVMRDVTMRTMQSLESVVKTVAALACEVADLARETREVRARRQGAPGGPAGGMPQA